MNWDRLFATLAALCLAAASGLTACTTAPATGRTIFTAGLSPADESWLGRQEHERVVPQFGGVYQAQELSAYVSSIGNLLGRTSETPDLKFTFTVLDTPLVNAFALPGGYVYVTRGLVALADDEAEIAGVLAHEIGHVTARHSAERYGRGVAASLANLGLGLLLGGGPVTDALGTASALALRSFSREQEYEADLLAVRYLARAGYDPSAIASFLNKLQAHGRLTAKLLGTESRADQFDLMRTHPRTGDRVAQAIREAGAKTVADPMRARDIYLNKIDGLLYGDSPKQGFIRGRKFLHPTLRFAFEVPEGFRLRNGRQSIAARGPEGAAIVVDQAPDTSGGSMPEYLTQVWARELTLRGVESLRINGMAAASGHGRVNTRGGPRDIRLVAIRGDANKITRMIFLTPPRLTTALSRRLRETTYSFRKLSPAEAAKLTPLRVRVHRVRRGESAAAIAARMPFEDLHLQRFLVLNGRGEGSLLRAGSQVKTITE